EDAVSTISQEYLLEFSSEYFIPENLQPLYQHADNLISSFRGCKSSKEKGIVGDQDSERLVCA
ncbi:hypothetical protein Tco_0605083, partial [Tanacetum coccineum]